MLPARQILPPAWMTDYKTVKVMRALGAYEIPSQALFVGGCVRNTLMEKPVTDIDIATIHQPLAVIERLQKEGIRFVPTGLEHGTLTAIVEDTVFEITTLRRDVDTDGRHAVIAFTEKWSEDAQRRDFTINTLLAAPDGMIFDPTGSGLDDLDKGRVAFVGEPSQRIAEDYLRILRFFRFYAFYGQGKPDNAALEACREHATKIGALSKERVTQEMLKILAAPNLASIIGLMRDNQILPDLLASASLKILGHLCELQQRHDAADIMARLVAVQAMETEKADALILSNIQKDRLKSYADAFGALKTVSRKKLRLLVYRLGNMAALQGYLLRLAHRQDNPDMDMLDIARYWAAPVFPVTGEMLLNIGMAPGPEIGKRLKELEKKWIKSDFQKVPRL